MTGLGDTMKNCFRRAVRSCGYDIVKWHPVPPAVSARKRLLDSLGINLVLDVGANAGQFASALRDPMGYRGDIVSFEPLPDAYALLKGLADKDCRWEARNVALGDANGELRLHVSKNRVSSSFLPIREASTKVEPNSAYEADCTVPVLTLDSVMPTLAALTPTSRVMLKLDTQGFEAKILAGADASLERLSLIQMEMSLVSLYEGEVLFLDMCFAMQRRGFELVTLEPGFADAASGRLLQVDGLFTKSAN